ncbi:MAG: ABC transporter permease, partial [Longimicrobiales bacterium]
DFRQFYEQVLDRVRRTPGVTAASAVQILTGTPNNWSFPTYPEGYAMPESGAMPNVNFRAVTPGYFETLEVPLLQGRTLTASDREDSEPVVVVNRAFVERFWPDDNPIGKTLSILSTDGTQHRVVGVVGDIRQHALNIDPLAELYVPYSAWPWEMSAWVLVRTDMPELLKIEARSIVDAVDPRVPVSGLDDLDKVIGRSAQQTQFLALLLTAFGVLGLTLGAIGVYGVTAHTVARRRAEFGVRFALGAKREDVLGSALRSGLTPVLLGTALGAALGLGGSRLLESYLYEVEPTDPATLAMVIATLILVAVSALAVPAWQASSISPTEALGSD